MPDIATTALAPDGYQVIDVTTGEKIYHAENEILTWQIAAHILAHLPSTGQYVVVAVTAHEVAKGSDAGYAEYLPQFFSFSLGTTRFAPHHGPCPTVAHNTQPDAADNEMCFSPRVTNCLIALLGLPVAPAPENEQKAWALDLVRDRLADTDGMEILHDVETTKALIDLRWLVQQAWDLPDVDLLLLDSNNFDVRSLLD